MDRRRFCQTSVFATAWAMTPYRSWASTDLVQAAQKALNEAGTNPASAALDGQERVMDPYRHYPSKAGIKDHKTGHSFFFHAHREREYGHFHTFSVDRYGAPVHVVMISVNARGEPFQISTTNQWVTGTRYIPAKDMKPFIEGFSMDPAVFAQPDLVRFVSAVIHAHPTDLMTMYEERDQWLARYKADHQTDPFKDLKHEVLSSRKIGPKK